MLVVPLDGAVFDVWNGIREEKYHRLVEKGWEHNDSSCWGTNASFRSIVEPKTRFSAEWMETESLERD